MSDEPNSNPAARNGPQERDYLMRRSEQHRQLAEKADEAGARMTHLRFLELYQNRANSLDLVLPD